MLLIQFCFYVTPYTVVTIMDGISYFIAKIYCIKYQVGGFLLDLTVPRVDWSFKSCGVIH